MQKDTSSLVFIQYLTTVFDNLGQSVLLISIEPENRYKVLLVNKTFGSTSGFPNDVVGKYVDEILPPAALEQVTARYQSALHTKQVVAYADWMETPRGRRRFDVKIIPIVNSVGECTQFVVMSEDITNEYQTKRERTAAIALNRYMVGDKRAFVVTDSNFVILRRLNLPDVMSDWETGAAIDTYLSKDDFSRFKELAKQADNKQQATFSLANQAGKRTFTYRLFYNPTLRRMIVHISLPMTALLCAPQLV